MIKVIGENLYTKNMDEIHSFDAYYRNVILRSNNIIIPYINLGVSLHPINETDKLMFLNFSYVVLENIKMLSVYIKDKRYFVIGNDNKSSNFGFGGTYLEYEEKIFNDIEVFCENAYLQTIGLTQLSDDFWIPHKTPNYEQNIDNLLIDQFFDFKLAPRFVLDFLD